MYFIVRPIAMLAMLFISITTASAQDTNNNILLADLNLNIGDIDTQLLLADNTVYSPSSRAATPNIPDSAFEKPMITANQTHMYLGLASMAFGALAGISAPDGYDPDLLNTVHFKAAKASWQLGAAAIGTGLWTHWDDFHLEDGIFDRDNLHVLLGTLGVVGYYLAVKGAVDEYNDPNIGYPSSDHASKGIFGGAAMITAIALTW
ncbi:MAG: hypothetical protein Q9M75_03260 [Ghiorsea sp.]|nr:hypothetical protein [Ghiorsea sp.]